VGEATANALGGLDLALENLGALPKLTPPPALSPEARKEFDAVGGGSFTPAYSTCQP
jgi:hypothetical protein